MGMYTTLNVIRSHEGTCREGYRDVIRKLQAYLRIKKLSPDHPITVEMALDMDVPLDNILWTFRCAPPGVEAERDRYCTLYACELATYFLMKLQSKQETKLLKDTISTVKRVAKNLPVTLEELTELRERLQSINTMARMKRLCNGEDRVSTFALLVIACLLGNIPCLPENMPLSVSKCLDEAFVMDTESWQFETLRIFDEAYNHEFADSDA